MTKDADPQLAIIAAQVERLRLIATEFEQGLRASEPPSDKWVMTTYEALTDQMHIVGVALYSPEDVASYFPQQSGL